MKGRFVFMSIAVLLVMLVMVLTDPSLGLIKNTPVPGLISNLVILLSSVIFIVLLHFSTKGLFDYIDMAEQVKNASRTPEGAGMVLIARGLGMIAIALVILAATA